MAPARVLRPLLSLLVIGLMLFAAWRYWRYEQTYASTDNAYIGAHTVQIAAQVAGPVTHVYVEENAHVEPGDELFDIDNEPFELALAAANSRLELARQSVDQDSASVQAAEAELAQRQAELQIARSNERRLRDLIERHFLSEQQLETAETQIETATAAVRAATANLQRARSALGNTGADNPTIRAAIVNVEQATLDLKHCHVAAPGRGQVANLTLRAGSTVHALAPLFTIINDQEFWVDANFKETELGRIRPGLAATITVDMYPDETFAGVVESISGGSGAVFSLLPPQNATGNWVKVTQRVPVRIRVGDLRPEFPLRIGTSAHVEVRIE